MNSYFTDCVTLEDKIKLRDDELAIRHYTDTCTALNDKLGESMITFANFVKLKNLLPEIKTSSLEVGLEDIEEKRNDFLEALNDPRNLDKTESTAYANAINVAKSSVENFAKSIWENLFNRSEFKKGTDLPLGGEFQSGLRKINELKRLSPLSDLDEILSKFPKNCKDLGKEIGNKIDLLLKEMQRELDEMNALSEGIQNFIEETQSENGKPLNSLSAELLAELIESDLAKDYKVVPNGE